MHKIEFEIFGKHRTYTAPGTWDELTRKQLLKWCTVLRMELNKKEALSLAVYWLYGFSKKVYLTFSVVQEVQLRQTMGFLTKNTLTKNILGYVSILFKKYHGPANRLTNLTIGEFRRTELYYDLYQRTGSKKFLYLLAATLYRPSGGTSDNDIRCKLTEKSVANRANLFSWALHPNYLLAIKLFYEGCRDNIYKSHPTIYQPSAKVDSKKRVKSPIIDLEDHILSCSGGKLGNFNETQETNLYVFLKHLCQRLEEYNEMKKKTN